MKLSKHKYFATKSNVILICAFTLLLISIKWTLIHYGLPYSTHVDETTILKDPFKIVMEYAQGNFSRPTNLFNWLFIGYAGLVYLAGSVFGVWANLEDYKIFMISGSGNVLLMGRMLSLIVSVAASLIFLKLIFKITDKLILRVLFSLLILFNPIEWNSTNWIKFDPYSYLLYSVILLLAYDYFTTQNRKRQFWMYLATFIGVSLRIEIVAYLIGFFIYDFFYFDKSFSFLPKIKHYSAIFGIGILLYCAITLLPLTLLFNVFHPDPVIKDITISPTFEEAIVTKLPDATRFIQSIIDSKKYASVLFSLIGPMIIVLFLLNLKNKESRFIYWPFLITVAVLIIFPVKETHYLLNVSILLIMGTVFYLNRIINVRKVLVLSALSLVWTGSYCFSFFSLIASGDVRIPAKAYLLERTKPEDVVLVEGIFSNIDDTPERIRLRSEAARYIGSTGLSSAYLANTVDPEKARHVIDVSLYEPFKGTPFSGLFTIPYDTAAVRSVHPKYFIYVARSCDVTDLQQHVLYSSYSHFFDFLADQAVLENSFLYSNYDPRLRYSNFYYFHPVLIYKFKPGF